MRYSFGALNKVFVLPTCVVDQHMKLAGALQIKVLLWIFRHMGEEFEIADISNDLSASQADVKDAMQYWFETGVLDKLDKRERGNETLKTSINHAESKVDNLYRLKVDETKNNKITKPSYRYEKPNVKDISKRMLESDEIKTLMQEAQQILGKTITNSDSGILLALHDRDGLPVDVILMLLQYVVSIGKKNMSYIDKVGRSWSEDGIDTLEKAESKIRQLDEENVIWSKFERIIGIDHRAPTAVEKEAVIRWMSKWKYDDKMIKEAYDRCVNANGKYVAKYIDSIISRWHKQGVLNINQALNERRKTEKTNKNNYSSKPSYNIEEYENYSVFDEDGWERHFIGG